MNASLLFVQFDSLNYLNRGLTSFSDLLKFTTLKINFFEERKRLNLKNLKLISPLEAWCLHKFYFQVEIIEYQLKLFNKTLHRGKRTSYIEFFIFTEWMVFKITIFAPIGHLV